MSRAPALLVAVAVLATLAVGGACGGDPVHDEEVAALGPEPGGGAPGPEHRPGQPCLVCHGGSGPASEGEQFAVRRDGLFQAHIGRGRCPAATAPRFR